MYINVTIHTNESDEWQLKTIEDNNMSGKHGSICLRALKNVHIHVHVHVLLILVVPWKMKMQALNKTSLLHSNAL